MRNTFETLSLALALLLLAMLPATAQTNITFSSRTNTIISSRLVAVVSTVTVTNYQRVFLTNHPVTLTPKPALVAPAVGAALLARVSANITTNNCHFYSVTWTNIGGQTGWLVLPTVTTNAP